MKGAGFGRWTRIGLGLELFLLVALSLAATLLVLWAAQWRPLRLRADLTRLGQNSLDPSTHGVLAGLPRPVRVDVFFTPVPGEVGPAIAEAQARTSEILFLLQEVAGEKVEVVNLAPSRVALREERARELGLSRDNVVVVSSGPRRVVLRLEADLASISLGDPRQNVPPSVTDLRAEEALVEALGRVSDPMEPRVFFSTGAGERNYEDLALARELRAEGFDLRPWDHGRGEALSEEATVLVLLGPEQPLSPEAVESVRGFVARGGSLALALGPVFLEGPGSPVELLEPYGLRPTRGIVCEPLIDRFTGQSVDGYPEVARLVLGPELLNATHGVTQPLAERGRRLRGDFFRALERGRTPTNGSVLALVASSETSWRDLPGAEQRPNWVFDPQSEERGRSMLVGVSEFPTSPTQDTRARVMAFGGLSFLDDEHFETNRDLVRNSFHWLSARDFRVRVARRDPFVARIDLERGRERGVLERMALWILPGGALLAGLVFWTLRRR